MHGYEDARVAEHLRRSHGQSDRGHLHEVDRLQQLVGVPEHVERAAAQRAERVGDHVEGRDDGRHPGSGVALRGGRLPVRGVGRGAGRGRVAQVEQGLQRGAYRRRGEQAAAHALQVVHVRQPEERRDHGEAFELAGDAREDGAERRAAGVGEELRVLLGLQVLALNELERRVVGQVAAGPAQLQAVHGLVAVRGEQAGGRQHVPAELGRRLAQAAQAQLVVVAGVAVGDALDLCREVVRHERDHRHAVGLLQGDDVVEALLALLVELLACESRHDRSPVHRALKLRAAETSLPQPSAPV